MDEFTWNEDGEFLELRGKRGHWDIVLDCEMGFLSVFWPGYVIKDI